MRPVPSPHLRTVATRAGALLLAALPGLLVSPLAAQEEAPSSWRGGVGVGLALSLAEADQETDGLGVATHGVVTRGIASGLRLGLQWDGAWFDGRFADEKRFLVSAVVERPLGDTPLVVRIGPGLGLATVVETDFPEEGQVGDGLVSIGDNGAWGVVAGVGGRIPLGSASLDPVAHLVWHRAGGIGSGSRHLLTLTFGGRLSVGG